MADDLLQYKDLYLQTSREYLQVLNNSLLALEKTPSDTKAIAEIFRSAHSLKSQSAAIGYEKTGYLCHTIEDIFYEIKTGEMELTPDLADLLFIAFDKLEASIEAIEKENHEIDLSSQAEKLKELTGVKTEGSGRSQREPESAPEKDINPPEIKKPVSKEKNMGTENIEDRFNFASKEIKSVNVKVEQLDEMMNLMKELIVLQLRLRQIVSDIKNEELESYINQSQKILESLQFQIMQARTIPVSLVFDHFPRAIRDLARIENKQIDFKVEGQDLELDRTIVDKLDEPLIHLLRNAVSHGIEKKGEIMLKAYRDKDHAIIEVTDNGKGIDWKTIAAKADLKTTSLSDLKKVLFSGLSTAEKVTQVSGRGVGLQVVKKMVERFGGDIDVFSDPGKRTSFILKLPLTLAVTKALLIKVKKQKYAIPALSVDRSIKINYLQVKKTADQDVFILDEDEVPLIRLDKVLKIREIENKRNQPKREDQEREPIMNFSTESFLTVVVSTGEEKLGLVVDEIIEAIEIVVKPIPEMLKGNKTFSGTTILGDGATALIINPSGLIRNN